MRARIYLTVIMAGAFFAIFLSGISHAASVRLSYGFNVGATYRVTEQHHDVGKTVTEINMMGQPQKFETSSDRVSSGTWTAKGVSKDSKGVKLVVEYGEHKGGDKWGVNMMDSARILGSSSADIVIHSTDGAVQYEVAPSAEQSVEVIYKSRFLWMPKLPKEFVRKGYSFTHEYVLKSGMYNIKSTDEYSLVGIKGNFVTFDVVNTPLGRYPDNSFLRYDSFSSYRITDDQLSISFSRDVGSFIAPRLIRYSITVDIGKSDDIE